MSPHVDAIVDELRDDPFGAVLALTAAMQSAAQYAKKVALVPRCRDAPAWTAHWLLRSRTAYDRGDAASLRDALRRVPHNGRLFIDEVGQALAHLDAEGFDMCLSELRAQQAQGDMEHDLRKEVDPQAWRAIRARAHRRIAALAPRARAVQCVTVLGADGEAAVDIASSAALLANHWGAVFAALERPDRGVVQRLLSHVRPLDPAIELAPPSFDDFVEMVGRTRHSAPGPDGVPYDPWLQSGESGLLILYKAYFAVLVGDSVLGRMNAS